MHDDIGEICKAISAKDFPLLHNLQLHHIIKYSHAHTHNISLLYILNMNSQLIVQVKAQLTLMLWVKMLLSTMSDYRTPHQILDFSATAVLHYRGREKDNNGLWSAEAIRTFCVLYGVSFMEQMDFSCPDGVRGLLVFIPPSNTLIRED